MEGSDEAKAAADVGVGVVTRIYKGKVGHIVMTVQADDAHAARLLGRICGAAVEAAVFKAFRDRLQQE